MFNSRSIYILHCLATVLALAIQEPVLPNGESAMTLLRSCIWLGQFFVLSCFKSEYQDSLQLVCVWMMTQIFQDSKIRGCRFYEHLLLFYSQVRHFQSSVLGMSRILLPAMVLLSSSMQHVMKGKQGDQPAYNQRLLQKCNLVTNRKMQNHTNSRYAHTDLISLS